MWIRTDYGPGTDGSFKEVLQGFSDNSSRREIVQDAKCYNLPDGDLKPVLAFFPILVGARDIYDSKDTQNRLFAAHLVDSLPKEYRKTHSQPHFFVADAEGMRGAFIRWIVPDQYGTPLSNELIQPWSLVQALSLRLKRTLQEFRDEIARGWYGDDPKYSGHIVALRVPPTQGC